MSNPDRRSELLKLGDVSALMDTADTQSEWLKWRAIEQSKREALSPLSAEDEALVLSWSVRQPASYDRNDI